MKKKVTNDNVGEILGQVADQIRSDMDFEFRVAQSQMWRAENDLIDTFTQEQKALYEEYRKKREAFYDIASEMYQRKI